MDEQQLNDILKRPGYSINRKGMPAGVKSSLGPSAFSPEARRARSLDDLESTAGDASLHAKKLQVSYSGKVRVRITFYRRRLADYSRAISEKALVDCLQYAGLIKGDSESEIWLEDGGQKKVETDQEERTEIELFYESVDLDEMWVKAASNKSR